MKYFVHFMKYTAWDKTPCRLYPVIDNAIMINSGDVWGYSRNSIVFRNEPHIYVEL